MPYSMFREPLLHGRQSVWFYLWQLVIHKLGAIVGLDALKRESWRKEPDGMFQEVDSVGRADTREHTGGRSGAAEHVAYGFWAQ